MTNVPPSRHPDTADDVNPFLDRARLREDLYASSVRLARRSGALLRARRSGQPVPEVIVHLARAPLAPIISSDADHEPARILDVGCGRGTTSLALSSAYPSAQVVMLDLSSDLLATARDRHGLLTIDAASAATVQADFHRMPLADGSCDLLVAAFCLYHARTPEAVITEFARCLRTPADRAGHVILVTKSKDSYRELDRLVAAAGLDEQAEQRTSLYETAHSGNIEELVVAVLPVQRILHDRHTFRFDGLAHVAQYLATVPKYRLPPGISGDADRIEEALRRHLLDRPVETSSTVTYVVAGGSRS